MFIIKYRKFFLGLSILLMLGSIGSIIFNGISFGIDFTGGTILEVKYPENIPTQMQVEEAVSSYTDSGFIVRSVEDSKYAIRTEFLSEETHNNLLDNLSFSGEYIVEQERLSSIGPVIGDELKSKAVIAIIIVVVAIILFVAFAFRRVSKPVSSWVYGLVAIIALIHDILIPAGVFAALSHFTIAEVDVLFVTALLAILGYSVNDTIVVFDRIRENLKENSESNIKESFRETVGKSLSQTITRSINTSLTTVLALLALFIFGGSTTHNFALTLLVGVIAGTYSSIFFASPLLVLLNRKKDE